MKELKSTVVGVFLMTMGAFFIYSDNLSMSDNNYFIYGCFGQIAFGIYLLFTTTKSRKRHMKLFIALVNNKFNKPK